MGSFDLFMRSPHYKYGKLCQLAGVRKTVKHLCGSCHTDAFCSPDAPACAVPVQDVSRPDPFRLGADQEFLVLAFFVSSFFETGDKKDRQLFAHCDQSTVSFRYSVVMFC